jgi:hypothetical protein
MRKSKKDFLHWNNPEKYSEFIMKKNATKLSQVKQDSLEREEMSAHILADYGFIVELQPVVHEQWDEGL